MYFNGHLIDKYIYIVTFKDKFFFILILINLEKI